MSETPNTPNELGYRWPAEWEPQSAIWLSWPRKPDTWPGRFEHVHEEFAKFVRAISEFEPVHIMAGGKETMARANQWIGAKKNVFLHPIETNDSWVRDHGPTFLSHDDPDRKPGLIDWKYNAWGGKYPPFDLDDAVPLEIAQIQSRKVFAVNAVLEGGAIETDGLGTLLTTRSCLLNPNRNPELEVHSTERMLSDFLSTDRVLWLNGGEVEGDDTDGHIDQLARFVNPECIVVAMCEDTSDTNYEPTKQNWRELSQFASYRSAGYILVPLPLPEPLFVEDQRLPASYCNFLIVNHGVIVPQFGDARADDKALGILSDCFPNRKVVGSPSRELVWGLGSFHCLSHEEPLSHLPRPSVNL